MKINLTSILLCTIIIGIASCSERNIKSETRTIAETDTYYSAMSAEKGRNAAFLAMFDSSGVILRPYHKPIEGLDSITKLLLSENDSSYKLIWKPLFSKTSRSGDLGYSYGTYEVLTRSTDSIIGKGTYNTIWKKQPDGSWKALLDTGNPGLGK